MARPLVDREATAEQLLEAAEDLIRERGAFPISVTDIAAACGMSQSNVYRFFPSKEALFEAIAERWFREICDGMEAVVDSDLPPRDKMFAFFARRLAIKRERFAADPALFRSYLALGEEHHEVVSTYLDLATHYLYVIVNEAIAEGAFPGKAIDEVVETVCLMTMPFCHPNIIIEHLAQASPENLRIVIDVIFAGLAALPEPDARPALLRLAG